MLNRLVELSLAQRMLVLVATSLAVAGVVAWLGLPIDAYPDIAPTQVKLILKAPGMTPEEVESRVVVPLKWNCSDCPMPPCCARCQVRDRRHHDRFRRRHRHLLGAPAGRRALRRRAAEPSGRHDGGLAPISTPLSDMLMFTIEGGGLTLAERRTLLDWTLRSALRTIPGLPMSTRSAAKCKALP
jgi:cobalt-zinc-cadmium resistance protein CzcA